MNKIGMTKEQIIEWGNRHGWAIDSYGHLRKQFRTGNHVDERRIKFQDTSVRIESRLRFEGGGNEWMHVNGGYYKYAHITPDDKLSFKK